MHNFSPVLLRRVLLLCLFSFFGLHQVQSQVVAGIIANGRIINQGDTVNVCKGSDIRYESAASGSLVISWRFNSGTPSTGTGIGPINVTYNTAGFDSTFQWVDGSAGFADSIFIIVRISDVKPNAQYNFAPDGQCGNIPVLFTSASTGDAPLRYLWNFDDGDTSSATNPTHRFLSAIGLSGTQVFQVKLVITNPLGCKDSIIKPVTVRKIPDASIGNASSAVFFGSFNGLPTFKHCSTDPFFPFQFTNTSTTNAINASYTIKWGDGSPDSTFTNWPTSTVITHVFPRGSSTMTVLVTGTNGCIGIKEYIVFLGTTPSGGLGSNGNEDICASQPLSFNINDVFNNPPGTQYNFYVNDLTPIQTFLHPPPASVTHFFATNSCGITSSNGSVSYSNSYAAYLTVTNPCGSKSPAVVPIYVSGKPKASISIPAPVVCVNTNVPITSSSLFGNVVTITGSSSSTCSNNGKLVWEISPSAGFTLTSGSLGSFNGSPLNGLLWTTGSNGLNVTFTIPGVYTIKVWVFNERCGYVSTTRTICVRNPPQASFTKNLNRSCGPAVVSFTNTSPTGTCQGDSYQWDVMYDNSQNCPITGATFAFVNGTSANSTSPSISFTRAGRYVIRLTTSAVNALNYCQGALAYDTFYVVGPPVATVPVIPGVCINNSVSPSATVINCYSPGPFTYQWTFTNGSPATSTSLVPGSINYTTNGTHTIQFIVKDENCNFSDTVITTVTISNRPQAEAGTDLEICSGTISAIGMTPVAGVNYGWTPISGLSNPAIANPNANLSYNGASLDTTYKYYLTASQGSNCSSIDSIQIKVKRKPVITVNPASAAICTGDTIQLSSTGASTYNWLPNTNLNANNLDTILAWPSMTTTYTVTGGIGNGCTDSKTVTITVRPKPVADAGNDRDICSADPVSIGMTPVSGITYSWTPANGLSNSNIANPVATLFYSGPQNDTTFTYYFTASLGSFCSSNDSVKIKVRRKPNVIVTPASATICLAEAVPITASGADTYTWSPATGLNITTGPNVIAQPQITTVYNVTGSLANNCTGMQPITITVSSHAKAEFAASATTLCAPVNLNTVITPTPYPLQNNSYSWYADGVLINTNTTGVFPSYIMNNPADTIIIKLVANSAANCKADSVEMTFITRPSIPAGFSKDKIDGCSPLTVNFLNTTPVFAGTQYNWNFGNGSTSTLYSPPSVTFMSSPTFRDTTYYITLSVNNGCVNTIKRDSVKVYPESQARFNVSNPSGCSPFSVTFNNTSRGNNTAYYWNFGDGQLDTTYSTGTLPHTYITGTIRTFIVQLIAENSCGRDTQTINIIVSPNTIQVNLQANGNQLTGCAPHTVTFNNTSVGAAQLTWNFGDGSTPVVTSNNQVTVTHTYLTSGIFIVQIRLQNNCSDTLIQRTISVFSKPIASFTVTNPIVCTGTAVTFANTSQFADGFQWFWGDGNNSTGLNPLHIYNSAGSYEVILVASKINPSGISCTDTARRTIIVRDKLPASIISTSNGPCAPFAYTAVAGNANGATLIEWFITPVANPQAVSYYTGMNLSNTFVNAGTYLVKLIVHTTANCKDSVTNTVIVYSAPQANFTPLNVLTCNHDTTLNLFATYIYNGTDPLQYNWFINGQFAGVGNPYAHRFRVPDTASAPAVFNIRALAQNSVGCGDTSAPGIVIVNPLPVPSIKVSPSNVLQQPDYTFGFKDSVNTNPNKVYSWDMGDRTLRRLNGQQITYTYGDTGTYKVKLHVINFQTGCSAYDSVKVTVLYVPGYLHVPNAMCMGCSNNSLRRFLPLGKGLKQYSLRIYNTYGQIIFESTSLNANGSPNESWDGTMKNKPLQQDTYTWQIEGRYINDTEWKGMIYPGTDKPVKAGFITIIK